MKILEIIQQNMSETGDKDLTETSTEAFLFALMIREVYALRIGRNHLII